MSTILATLRPLRVMLAAATLALVVMRPFAGGKVSYSDWTIVPGVIVPALVPIIFFVLMLDMLMTNVFRLSNEGAERARMARILKIEAVLLALLLLAWVPFFLSLGN